MIETIQADWIKSEAINLENCCNDNPLKILGPHFFEEQWVIRVWMPEADEVKINFKNNTYKAEGINHKWLFEAILPENPNSNYEINISRGGSYIHKMTLGHTEKSGWGKLIDIFLQKVIIIIFGEKWEHISLKKRIKKESCFAFGLQMQNQYR